MKPPFHVRDAANTTADLYEVRDDLDAILVICEVRESAEYLVESLNKLAAITKRDVSVIRPLSKDEIDEIVLQGMIHGGVPKDEARIVFAHASHVKLQNMRQGVVAVLLGLEALGWKLVRPGAVEAPSRRRVQFKAEDAGEGPPWDVSVDGKVVVTNVTNDELDIGNSALDPIWEALGVEVSFEWRGKMQ